MTNTIRFLEALGQDPALSRLSPDQLRAAIESLELEPAQKSALLAGDFAGLSQLMGGRDKMVKLVWEPGPELPADGEEPDGVQEDPSEPEDAPSDR